MDTKKPAEAFTPEETREPVADLLAEELKGRVVRPGELPGTIGATAARGTEASQMTSEEQAWHGRISRLLDPETHLDITDQLSVMREFWGNLGYQLPPLSKYQLGDLAEAAESQPGHRVVPTLLSSLIRRRAIVKRALTLPDQASIPGDNELWRPDKNSVYRKLLWRPENSVIVGDKTYGLRFKTEAGDIVSRAAHLALLKETGRAVEAKKGNVWTFPVMDVRFRSKRTFDTAGNLYPSVDFITAPESLIAVQLLHQASGIANPEQTGPLDFGWEADFANEAVYELDEAGNPKALFSVASVSWALNERHIGLGDWHPGLQVGGFGVRDATSGLKRH